MFHPLASISFKGYTLIIPSVSVGNVGQLTVDLLVASLKCVKAGFLWHKAILPLVGADPYKTASPTISVGAEVYYSDAQKLVLVQLRSSICKDYQKEFLEAFTEWAKSEGVLQVVILTGSSNEERIDKQITSEPFRFVLCQKSAPRLSDVFSKLGWIALEKRHKYPALSRIESQAESSGSSGNLVIAGGGFSKRLYDRCCQEDVQWIIFVKFCSEGDNIPDALFLAGKLNTWLNIMEESKESGKEWSFPPSWTFLFGNPPPKQLY